MHYPAPFMLWLYGILKGTGFSYTVRQIIEDERFMPGVWGDIGLLMWQERLIEDQINAKNRGNQE